MDPEVLESTQQRNKKQCSRQLQCEVPCGVGNVINSSLFINSSLSSLSSTSHAVHGGGGSCLWLGGIASSRGREVWQGGGGQGTFQSSCHIYCTTTWCFALKGLRTINLRVRLVLDSRARVPLQVTFPQCVRWLVLEFDPQCGTAQAEDSLQLSIPAYRPAGLPAKPAPPAAADAPPTDAPLWPVLKKYHGTNNWPSSALILPGE